MSPQRVTTRTDIGLKKKMLLNMLTYESHERAGSYPSLLRARWEGTPWAPATHMADVDKQAFKLKFTLTDNFESSMNPNIFLNCGWKRGVARENTHVDKMQFQHGMA